MRLLTLLFAGLVIVGAILPAEVTCRTAYRTICVHKERPLHHINPSTIHRTARPIAGRHDAMTSLMPATVGSSSWPHRNISPAFVDTC